MAFGRELVRVAISCTKNHQNKIKELGEYYFRDSATFITSMTIRKLIDDAHERMTKEKVAIGQAIDTAIPGSEGRR